MPWGMTLALMTVTSVAVATYIAWPLLVGRPETNPEGEEGEGEDTLVLDELLLQKDATYSAIKELEFDHAMGNLSKEDYRELAGRYEDKAMALLKTIDQVSQGNLVEDIAGPAVAGVVLGTPPSIPEGDAIEQQVAGLRRARGKTGGKGRTASLEDEVERDVARMRGSRLLAHGGNGNPAAEIEQRVAALRTTRAESTATRPRPAPTSASPTRASCPACGAPLKSASAAFCSRCGAALPTHCPACGTPAEEGDAFCSGCGSSLTSRDATGSAEKIVGGANA